MDIFNIETKALLPLTNDCKSLCNIMISLDISFYSSLSSTFVSFRIWELGGQENNAMKVPGS